MPADQIEVSPVPVDLRDPALDIVFAHLSPEDRAAQVRDLLETVDLAPHALDGLFTVSDQGQLLGAGLSQLQPGRAAVIWSPREQPNLTQRAADALIETLVAFAKRNGAVIAQSLLAEGDAGEGALLRAGFLHATDLAFLVALAESFPTSGGGQTLNFETYSTRHHDRLTAIIDQTYIDSLDCPAMNGVRDVEDVLAGYRATGSFSPNRWLIVRAEDHDIGCLLLADHPAVQQWELVYMGLIPAARGKGYGVPIARHALWMAGQAGRQRMVVAVDMNNHPALRVYETTRFVVWDRRRVFLKQLRGDESPLGVN